MELKLAGKVALVAGASRGLGYAIARRLAAEGANVSIAARGEDVAKAATLIEEDTGSSALGMMLDVRSEREISDWCRATSARFGGIDMLCVNAGGPPPGSFDDLDDEAWRDACEQLLLSAVRQVRCALPYLRAKGGGAILLLTSSAVKEPIANLTLSNVVRAAVAALSKSLAVELAREGIRVNQLVPGRILTERVQRMDEVNAAKASLTVDEQRRRSWSTIPLGRYGEPDEFARAAAFLLSDAASYVTGATLQVDGGLIRSVA